MKKKVLLLVLSSQPRTIIKIAFKHFTPSFPTLLLFLFPFLHSFYPFLSPFLHSFPHLLSPLSSLTLLKVIFFFHFCKHNKIMIVLFFLFCGNTIELWFCCTTKFWFCCTTNLHPVQHNRITISLSNKTYYITKSWFCCMENYSTTIFFLNNQFFCVDYVG